MDTPIRRRPRRFGTSPAAWRRDPCHRRCPAARLPWIERRCRARTPLAVTDPESLNEAHSHSYSVIARRRPEVTETAVVSALGVYGKQVEEAHRDGPASGPTTASATARSLYDSRVDADLRRVALIVLGAVGFVLLIACVNLTNLLIAQAIARSREVAIRVALGAGRRRVARQFAVESLMLAAAGAVGGLSSPRWFSQPRQRSSGLERVLPYGRPRHATHSRRRRSHARERGDDWLRRADVRVHGGARRTSRRFSCRSFRPFKHPRCDRLRS